MTGVLLVDPGVNPLLCDEDDGGELPFTWRGVQEHKPNTFYCNELITKGKIRIYPELQKIEGFFEYIDRHGSLGDEPGGICAFLGKAYYKPPLAPSTLEKVAELWNYYLLVSLQKEKVR